jgi:hypothetical protein
MSAAFSLPDFVYIYNIDCSVLTLPARFISTSYLAYIQLTVTYLPTIMRKSRLPKRSVDTFVRLTRRICLRCSKRISIKSIHRCGFKNYKKCDACLRKYKECKTISISLLSQRR